METAVDNSDYGMVEGNFETPGVEVKGISALVDEVVAGLDVVTDDIKRKELLFQTTLAGHIRSAYQTNKNARRESDIEQEIINSMYQVNMEYRDAELAAIKTGSKIYMGITATKSSAARSWIKDIIQPANTVPFKISQTASPDLPPEIISQIEEAFEADRVRLEAEIDKETAETGKPPQPAQPQDPNQPQQTQAPTPISQAPSALIASKKLKRTSELRRDIEESIKAEIERIANADIKRIETKVVDQLQEGSWSKALSDFIEDFTIYPTAFMKGPVVSTKKRLTWENGMAIPKRETVFLNKRVSPLDIYPSPSAVSIYDGNFVEHVRLTKKELSDLSFLDSDTGFKKDSIIDILNNVLPAGNSDWIDSEVEEDKQHAEKRGSQTYASEGIYHGAHFWGTASAKMLKEWGYDEADISEYPDHQELEVEAIMIGNTVIKCLINRDPLGRRPYYSASFQTRSGSLWGKSLPYLMRDIQRMCNACARALSDNMGLSSGPQVALLVDRLASDGDISEIEPRMVHQFTSDPAGNGGKPIEFFSVQSNAQELLAVYDKFEIKADDVTGVPRYAYGNENVGGAGSTARGLSMLLESATKGIKASIKNISEGLIIPRIEYQFYLHLLNEMELGNPSNFSGDINVVVHAAEAMTIKAAEAELQKDLLGAISTEPGMAVMGLEGYGDVLRAVFKGANLPEEAIPSRLALKEKEAKNKFDQEQAQQQQADQANQKGEVGLRATKLQTDAQMKMHEGTQATKNREIDERSSSKNIDQQLKGAEIQQRSESEAGTLANKLQDTEKKLAAEGANVDRKLAVDVVKNRKETPSVI